MDHMNRILPQAGSTIGTIDIPLLASEPYDRGDFFGYPRRHGLDLGDSAAENPLRNVAPGEPLGAALQTWMYFGLLEYFLNEPVDMSTFERRASDGAGGQRRLLSSAPLEELVRRRITGLLAAYRALGKFTNLSWSRGLTAALEETCRVTTLVAKGEDDDPGSAVGRVCLGVALLAEYLGCALSGVLLSLAVADPFASVSVSWREHAGGDVDHGRLVVRRMLEEGWCPAALPVGRFCGIAEVTTLWFVANLPRPMAGVDHGDCSEDVCRRMQITEDDYEQVHENGCGGGCVSTCGPAFAELAAIIAAGDLPLVTVKKSTTEEVEVGVKRYRGQDFVAISHVWSDGRGSPDSNTLPACVLRHLQGLANTSLGDPAAGDVPFWMDTLCLPCPGGGAEQQRLRKLALRNLKMPYARAAKVVVVDSYLLNYPYPPPPPPSSLSLSSSSPSPRIQAFEFMAAVVCSGWFRRLWTYQESRLAKRLLFAFGGRLESLEHEVDLGQLRALFARSHIPPFFFGFIRLVTLAQSSVPYLWRPPGRDASAFDESASVKLIRSALQSRATSKAEDEPLCVASVLGLPDDAARDLVYCPPATRMSMLWSKLPELPSDLAFSRAGGKLGDAGFRWAPRSFLGARDLDVSGWLGRYRLDTSPATLLPGRGLAIQRPAWFLRPRDRTASALPMLQKHVRQMIVAESDINLGIQLHVPDAGGRWFTCQVREHWHAERSDLEGLDQLAILVNSGTSFSRHLRPRGEDGPDQDGGPRVVFEGFESLGQGNIMHLSVDPSIFRDIDAGESTTAQGEKEEEEEEETEVIPGLMVACRADSPDGIITTTIQTAAMFHIGIVPVPSPQAHLMNYAAECAERIKAEHGVLEVIALSPRDRAECISQEVDRSLSRAPPEAGMVRRFLAYQLSLDPSDADAEPPDGLVQRVLLGYIHTFLLTGMPVLEPASDSFTWIVD